MGSYLPEYPGGSFDPNDPLNPIKPTPVAQPTQWNAASDPIIGPGPAGTNLHRTRSGRWVDNSGNYVKSGITDKAIIRTAKNSGGTHAKSAARAVNRSRPQGRPVAHRPARPAKPVTAPKDFLGAKAMAGRIIRHTPADPPTARVAYHPTNQPSGPTLADLMAMAGMGQGGSGSSSTSLSGFAGKGGNVGQMIDPKTAAAIAAGQYAPQINDLENQIRKAPGQTAQNKADINHWMAQVVASMGVASQREDTSLGGAAASSADAAKGIAASLGGADTPASAEIGAQGADNAAMFQALKGSADTFSADMGPVIALSREGQLSKQDAAKSALLLDLNSQLAGAKGAQAGTQAQEGMSITQANNQLAQQRWANKFGILQAQAAAQMSGNSDLLKNVYTAAKIAKIQSDIQHANDKKLGKVPKPGSNVFAGTSATNLGKIGQVIASRINTLKTSNPKLPASTVVQTVNQIIGSYFPRDNMGSGKMTAWRNHIFQLLGIDPSTQGYSS